MKKYLMFLLFACFSILYSCDGNNTQQENNESDLEIQGEETGGMGTGPGPGVDVTLDTAENIQPDTIVID